MIIKTSLSGGHHKHSRYPWDRDTTRGMPNLDSAPSMHSSEVEATIKIATCQCCAVDFGYEMTETKAPAYCPSHRWLGEECRIGVPLLNGIQYVSAHEANIQRAERIQWAYCFLESDPECRKKLAKGLRAWIETQRQGFFAPTVVTTSKAVVVMDCQRLAYGSKGGYDYNILRTVFQKLDLLYTEVL